MSDTDTPLGTVIENLPHEFALGRCLYCDAALIDGEGLCPRRAKVLVKPIGPSLADRLIAELAAMTDDQRTAFFGAIFYRYCRHCGRTQADGRQCQCWNDE